MSVEISVVICTHNQAKYLPQAIKSILNQTLDSYEYELIVVDNCSTDNTKKCCETFLAKKQIRYVYEPTLGLSHSRNTGLTLAKGRIISYIDDDAIASPDWLKEVLLTFDGHFEATNFLSKLYNSKIACVGGKVLPKWESKRPSWLEDDQLGLLTVLDLGDSYKHITKTSEELFGTNMSFDVKILRKLGGFNTQFGRKGSCLLGSEDVLVQEKLRKNGFPIVYNPRANVEHTVRKERLRKEWFYRRLFWSAVSDVHLGRFSLSLEQGIKDLSKITTFGYRAKCHVWWLLGRIVAPFLKD